MKTVVGMYDRLDQARAAVHDLEAAGVRQDRISILGPGDADKDATTTHETTDTYGKEGAGAGATAGAVLGGGAGLLASLGLIAIPGIGPVLAAGAIVATLTGAGIGAGAGALIGGLIGLGIPEEDAENYEEGLRRGHSVVLVQADDNQANDVADILDRHDAIDVDKRAAEWRQAGWQPRSSTQTQTQTQNQRPASTGGRQVEGEERIPIVNEELRVGKREVSRGGIRVFTRAHEEPVEETVRLHEERVRVERRPADRPASQEDMDRMRDDTIDVRARSEEAVVQKEARVTEEVVVRKDATEREETVRGTVRHTDVEVQKLSDEDRASRRGYDDWANDFRTYHQQAYASRGVDYDQASPVYQSAYQVAGDNRYKGRDFEDAEPEIRRQYEQSGGKSSWDSVRDYARFAYNRVTGKV